MAPYEIRKDLFNRLKGKVIVITGGSNGIGAAAVKLFASHGAFIFSGDLKAPATAVENVTFLETDITSYASLLALFHAAFEAHGKVDIAVNNAAILEPPGVFGPEIDLEMVKEPPNLAIMDVNAKGSIYFARIASVYLQQTKIPGEDKALILTSSIAGITHTPGLTTYCASKHAVIGLMRPLARFAKGAMGFRTNCVCPWTTKTDMVDKFLEGWVKEGFAVNETSDVAAVYASLALDGTSNANAIYVEGGRAWETEQGLYKLGTEWMGEEPWKEMTRGQRFFASTDDAWN